MFPRAQAKNELKAKGWSYRAAAIEVGVCYQHIWKVLAGVRNSDRLLAALQALPVREPRTPANRPRKTRRGGKR